MIVQDFLTRSAEIKLALSKEEKFLESWSSAAKTLQSTVSNSGTIYLCGNGGSACDAMHFREELVARYKRERPGIKAQHFMDSSTMTCWGNDYSYESLFEREAKTFLQKEDCLVALSTSGNSANVLKAVEAAKEVGCPTIALTGKDGGKLSKVADISLIVPAEETDRIQEVHITLIHAFCEFLETK